MKTSIPSLIVGDVIQTNEFTAEVVETRIQESLQRSVVYLKFISGNKFNFNFLGGAKDGVACIAGNELAMVWLEKPEFIAE